ncbi:adenylate/guanylate cyclase domain-containing protein [Mesorhizobium delmotii]|uniref:Putative adenylate cyclase n=1 Tax=Mesorhizobium delmotii TaxID=1631247 RepID=A0A2P9AHC7_9HYPH|nr:adenylate/guanylate cyclase domain-containing protein [Mesorhizobium delmotii]SJM30521.1 putative adenylate cyclase [Mesorhizobium delmotii]
MPDIASWLTRLGLDKYIEAFTANEVDFDALRHLTENDLRELGLPVGPRRKVLAAIAALDDDTMSPASSVSAPVSAALVREAERRQLTVTFIDLVGSTELSQRLDPEEMRDVIRAYQSAVSAEIARYEGYVAKLMGDGVLTYFGWPRAHEDDAERAVRASLAAAAATASLTTPSGEPLAARIGIATGLVVVGDLVGEGSAQEEAVVGETPNLAARLQALAEPNNVVVAGGTHRLVVGLFDMIDLGHQQLKGFATPVPAWRITGEADAEGRFDALHGVATPLVGRSEELELLLQRWQQARAGKGQAILLSGEPGIGKSRLTAALEERLSSEPHARLRYFCSTYHANSALYPVTKQLERAAGLGHSDTSDTKLDKLETLLRQAVSDIAETVPLLVELLSIDTAGRYAPLKLTPQARKSRTLTTLIQLLEGFAARQPVVMVIEDAHWIDPTTSEWLDMLIDGLQNLPVLLIITFRPEFKPRWTLLSYVTAVSLSRLDHDQGSAIVDRVAGGKALPTEVRNQILAKTEGVPLFVEELTKTVLESGLLIDSGDHYVLSVQLPSFAIPSTLQDSLMARLDRFAPVKEVAQIGACIGRIFQHRLLAAVTGYDDAQLEGILQQLEESELAFRRGVPPEATYTFKHALVQDTAYQSLLKSRRQQIHAVIASALEAQFREITEAEPETLAHHYTAAGNAEQAIEYWLKAGQQALKRSANREAVAHLGKGLEVVGSLPDSEGRLRQELRLQNAMAVAMKPARGWSAPEVLEAFSKARTLAEKLGDKNQLFVALCGEASYHMVSGNLPAADELGLQCLELAGASGDPGHLLEAHHQLWATKYYLGDYAAAEAHVNFGIVTYDPDRHHALTYTYSGHDPGVCCRIYSASILWLRGYTDQALVRCREANALAERVSHPITLVLAQSNLTNVHLMRREPGAGRQWLQKWTAQAQEFALPILIAQGKFYLGWVLAEEGRAAEGIPEMRDAIAVIGATGVKVSMPYYLCVLARACGECDEASEGLDLLDKGLSIAESGSKYQLPELFRTKGELLLRQNPNDDTAESWFRRAMTMARDEGTKSLKLRAALSLARRYHARDRDGEARDLLTPVYAWFTEGLDTRDLVEAKELLDQFR